MITVNVEKSNRCNGNYSAYLSFPYDEEIIGAVRSLSDRAWDNANKVWEIPYGKLLDILMQFPNHEVQLHGEIYEAEHDLMDDINVSYDYDFKTTPYSYQMDGFNYGMNHNNWLLADEQGLGKTKQIIDIACAKKEHMNYQHCLIICGVNGLKWNWVNEIHTHSNEDGYILGQKTRKNGRVYIGSSEDKLACLDNIDELPYFIITNVETLRYGVKTGNKVKKSGKMVDEVIYPITDRITALCEAGKINMVAIDEIHRCKNSKSQQGEQMLRVVADTNIAMTGTPLMNKPFDIYTILKWLGYEKHSLYQFSQHYCVYGGWGGCEVVGYKNLEELNTSLNTIMLRRLKSDVFDLPEKVYIDEYVEMNTTQAKVYNMTYSGLLSDIENVYAATNPLTTLIRLRQATGYTGIVTEGGKESAKLDRLEELAEDIVENGEKFVVFSNWTAMTDILEERLAKYDPVVVTGETKDEDRTVAMNIFQNDPRCKCIIGTIGALGTGFTLTAGNNVIFVDHPWNRALYDQAVDRCHRIGTTKTVTVYNLLTKDTIDERVWEIVKEKGELSDAIVDGKIVMNKKELVDYLLS